MYLSARAWLSKHNADEAEKAEKIRAILPEMFKSGNLDSIEIQFEVGYWRKANQIHRWFVKNCQDGVDDCRESYVSREDLQKLSALCEETLASPNPQVILPTQSGFFFGRTDYDECYRDDLKHTIEVIKKALTLSNIWEFRYHSSW